MRVTKEAKENTRRRILGAARKAFQGKGFVETSTRDIAVAARIAAGTLFNYFPTKEALAVALISDALAGAEDDRRAKRRGDESLEEDLFLHVMTGLRKLEPYRPFLAAVLETTQSPLLRPNSSADGAAFRVEHLKKVGEILVAHGVRLNDTFLVMQLYWTLYLGVLAFWSRDESPGGQDMLALLDQSLRMFVSSLLSQTSNKEDHHAS